MAANANLHRAKTAKDDEFYTQLTDIEKELRHYKDQLRGAVVLCNCDDPEESNFWQFFSLNFEAYGLKKLISTHFDPGQPTYKLELSRDTNGDGRINGLDIVRTPLAQNGDFRSPECVALLEEADFVITNPPFSLFREYVTQLVEHGKKFLIIGSQNALTYQDVFPHIMNNRVWLGHNQVKEFRKPDGSIKKFGNVCWFTNLDTPKRHEELVLYRSYNPIDYPRYDNYDAIEVAKVVEIPLDYEGVMGVPLTFLSKYNPDQFEIVGVTQSWFGAASKLYPPQVQVTDGKRSRVMKLNDGAAIKVDTPPAGKTYYEVDGEFFTKVYARFLIRRRES